MAEQKKKLLVSLDIETKCARGCEVVCDHALFPESARITCVGLYTVTTMGSVHKKVYRDLKELNEVIQRGTHLTFVGHNFKFDLHHLNASGVKIPTESWAFDTQLMAHASLAKIPDEWLRQYEEERKLKNLALTKGHSHRVGRPNSLKTLAPYFLKVEPFWEDPTQHDNDEYVLKDCEYTYKLCHFFEKTMREEGTDKFFSEKVMPWARMLYEIESRGVQIDMGELELAAEKSAKDAQASIDKLCLMWHNQMQAYKEEKEKKLYALYTKKNQDSKKYPPPEDGKLHLHFLRSFQRELGKTCDFNFDSPQQILHMLRDRLNLSVKNLDGKDSSGKEVLQTLADQGREDVQELLKYRHNKKLLTSFFSAYRDRQCDGILRCSFNADGTRTGRLSSSSVNLQQVSGDLRNLFKPRPNMKFVVKDLNAIEPRLAAYFTEDPRLCKIMIEDKDFHSENAIIMCQLGMKPEEVKVHAPNARKLAKTCGLALLYGAGAKRIQQTAIKMGENWSEGKCKEIYWNFRNAYKSAFDFKAALDFKAAKEPIPNIVGRKHIYLDPDKIYMKCFNTLIQSSASDMLLLGVWKAYNKFKDLGVSAMPVLLVHDEVVFEVPEDQAESCEKIIEESITGFKLPTPFGDIPLKSEGGIATVWEK